MKRFHILMLAVMMIGPLGAWADDTPPVTIPPKPSIHSGITFPTIGTVTPTPQVAPVPGAVPILSAGQWYVITADTRFWVEASDEAKVSISYEEGPLKLRGIFADGSGKIETRTYQAKYLAIVDAVEGQSGRIKLSAFPYGFQADSDITRQLIDLGVAPQPPPVVIVPDPPKPPVPVIPSGFRVMMVYETSAANSKDIDTTINSTRIREYLKAKCVKAADGTPEFRVWDKDTVVSANESPTIRELWIKSKPLIDGTPQLIVAVNGEAKVYPMPANEAATLTFLKTLGGE